MEKKLAIIAYWIGIACTVIAVIERGLAMIGVWGSPSVSRFIWQMQLSGKSFLDGAMLFFLMAVASSAALWVKTHKPD